jgi:hypothetical protein
MNKNITLTKVFIDELMSRLKMIHDLNLFIILKVDMEGSVNACLLELINNFILTIHVGINDRKHSGDLEVLNHLWLQ